MAEAADTGTATLPREAIHITGLVKSFGPTRALRGVDLTVAEGECHALLGRNGAGKSTLIAILTGLERADEGTILVAGDAYTGHEEAIACVYQKSTLVPDLSVAENIVLGTYPTRKGGLVDWKAINQTARDLLAEWDRQDLAERLVSDLEPIERKIVEICRALSRGPRILLLDEPTAGLDGGGVDELFRQVEELKARGVTVIYVSHHLEEIFQICDQVTILRDGKDVMSKPVPELTMDEIISAMTGTQAGTADTVAEEARDFDLGDTKLHVEDLSVPDRVEKLTFTVRAGERVGITGLDGAGHIQVGRAIAGQQSTATGSIRHVDRSIATGKPLDAIKAGVGFVPEDRHINGYVPELSVEENATLTILHRIRNRFGLLNFRSRRKRFTGLADTWSIVCSGPDQPVEELSGGNQQKVVLARALASDPDILVVINPTAGVDIAAKRSIYTTLDEMARRGKSVIIVSSDDDDLRICDRVIAMHRGRQAADFARGYSDDDLIRAVQGGDNNLTLASEPNPGSPS